MKSDLHNLIKSAGDQQQALNWMREYLQARVLAILQDQGAMIPLAFHGGTALRFLYQLPRFSEDLDFSYENQGIAYDFQKYLSSIISQLTLEGYPVTVKFNDKRVVQSAFINFPGLMYDFDISPHPDQNFTIKLEIDTNPPKGATLTTSLIRHRELILNLQHHDRASLLAAKVHAILQRKYLKGRDIYDLMWYLSDPSWPLPNLSMLNAALAQSGWEDPQLTPNNWRAEVKRRLQNANISQARRDVAPFLARIEDQQYIQWEYINQLLSKSE